ncbi:MAG: hypothetical protein M0029_10290, partial [Actinomycetota bacterium]|nr:hypothetical protein [Actinomycetota bacterium]
DLIGDTDLAEAAAALDLGYWACHKRRRRAESLVRDWVTGDDYPPFDNVQKTGESGCSVSGDCRRPVRSMDRRPGKRRSNPPPRR